MKIVVVGDPDSIWTKTYIENILLNKGNEIYILGQSKGTYDTYYKEYDIRIIDNMYKNPQKRLSILYYSYIWTIRQILKLGKIDIFHVHFVTLYSLRIMALIKWKCKRAVVSYWGSDLLRTDAAMNKKMKRYLVYADFITVCTENMKQVFQKIYDNRFMERLAVIDFGINTYKVIDDFYHRTNIIRKYNFSEKTEVVIMIGYNGKEEQQHIKVLEQINLLPVDLQKRIKIVIPLTYGLKKQSYAEKLKRTIEERGHYQYSLLTKYLSPEEMTELYASTDIMIHAQTTDALSGTIQELLYSGVLVLNPEWLIYREMEERDIFYIAYSDFEEMREKLKRILENGCPSGIEEKLKRNKKKLKNYSGWEALAPKWTEIISKVQK